MQLTRRELVLAAGAAALGASDALAMPGREAGWVPARAGDYDPDGRFRFARAI